MLRPSQMSSAAPAPATDASEDAAAAAPPGAAHVRWSQPGLVAFWTLLAAAVGLRVYALISYPPAVLTSDAHDAADYVRAARLGLSHGSQEPLGYPLFLRVLHALSHQLIFTVAVQHALGIAAGVLLFLAVRRLGAPVLAALVPAAVLWFNGDQLFLEHALLSEALFTLFVTATLYAAVRSLDGDVRWAILAGSLSAVPLALRTVGELLPVVVIVWIAVAMQRTGVRWRRAAALALGSAVAVTAVYGIGHSAALNRWSIVPDGTGWNLYARAAEFASCRDFTPPSGTRTLCERTPPSKRPGRGYYLWVGGPARRAFGQPDSHDHLVGEFALAAIKAQPLDYVALVGTDIVRYAFPTFESPRAGDFPGPTSLAFPAGRSTLDPQTAQQVSAYYGPVHAPTGAPARGLHDYQRVMRVTGVMLLALLILGCAGVFVAPRRVRLGITLMLAVALELLLVPTLTGASWRYALPAEGPLAGAAALGGWTLARWLRARRSTAGAAGR